MDLLEEVAPYPPPEKPSRAALPEIVVAGMLPSEGRASNWQVTRKTDTSFSPPETNSVCSRDRTNPLAPSIPVHQPRQAISTPSLRKHTRAALSRQSKPIRTGNATKF